MSSTCNFGGAAAQGAVHPDRNGYIYCSTAHRRGALAKPFAHITSSTGVDLKTGRLQYAPDKQAPPGKVVRDICPAPPGAKDWQPSAYSPQNGVLYIPHNNLCNDAEHTQVSYIAGTPYVGTEVRMYAGPGGNRGEFTAWDVAEGRKLWSIKEEFPVWSGAAVTAGDVVFYGTMDGWFKAVDAKSGDELWKFKTGSGIIGQPIDLPRTGRQAVCRDPVRGRRLGRRDRIRRCSIRATAPPRSALSTR